jgi:serine/threonine protein phosphatase PrpC
MSINIETGKDTSVGLVRDHNEDSFLVLELSLGGGMEGTCLCLAAVADGLGGHEGGEIASDLALRILADNMVHGIVTPALPADSAPLNGKSISKLLQESIQKANSEVYKQGQLNHHGMATTLVAAVLMGQTACIANVGDSRIYLLEDGKLRQISKDHSLVQEMVDNGKIKPEQIYTHPLRNIISRCLGLGAKVDIDLFHEELKPGNSRLLCSDGLWEMIRDNELRDIMLAADSAQSACDRLIEQANENGGVDNITAIVIRAI